MIRWIAFAVSHGTEETGTRYSLYFHITIIYLFCFILQTTLKSCKIMEIMQNILWRTHNFAREARKKDKKRASEPMKISLQKNRWSLIYSLMPCGSWLQHTSWLSALALALPSSHRRQGFEHQESGWPWHHVWPCTEMRCSACWLVHIYLQGVISCVVTTCFKNSHSCVHQKKSSQMTIAL